MRKLFHILVVVVLLPICASRCAYDCPCYDDSDCSYYCRNSECQQSIPLWEKCSGYYIHPRECGLVSYCDPNSNYTCQLQKSNGDRCKYSYSCLSGYCDRTTDTCQFKYSSLDWSIRILLPSVLFFVILSVFLVAIIVCRRRRRTLAYYRSPYVVLPAGTPYSDGNSCIVTEASPPPYPAQFHHRYQSHTDMKA